MATLRESSGSSDKSTLNPSQLLQQSSDYKKFENIKK